MARILRAAAFALLPPAVAGCVGPLAIDATPHVRGRVVAVDGRAITLRHKSGRRVVLVVGDDTRIFREGAGVALSAVCPSQHAHAVLSRDEPDRMAELSVTGPRCGH